jgi:hypothetical protein
VLVVAAPADSRPNSPLSGTGLSDIQPWVEDTDVVSHAEDKTTDASAVREVYEAAPELEINDEDQSGYKAGDDDDDDDDDEYTAWMDNVDVNEQAANIVAGDETTH